ncbi:MAG TPA: nuclear transport factor 2 family protein [Pyrinomonadaceae bacterium]|nr:nuclear transport factor 2 family protein [Pyrinomonadaceae bacterium]
MKRFGLKAAVVTTALLIVPSTFRAQEPVVDPEKEAIKRAVETFLYAEERDQVARVIDPQAKIFSIKSGDNKVSITPISTPAKKLPKGARTRAPRQRITNIEIFADGAVVAVQTDRMTVDGPSASQKHIQYISLMRFNGEWKIVSILMPSINPETETRK